MEEYVNNNTQSKVPFEKWLFTLEMADWNFPIDMFFTFNTADILGKSSQRVIFNIGGNKYRVICKYNFG
ncbi:type II toxin-antitoxin system HigB family toxin [Brumimicrobium mesophilum]|uniref:type II toxin-antitoxin system HigB family toxin n=1 Tax=Brumimicrobium mesophilum TaxID=392717 RepID=UPI0037428A74